MMFKNLIKATIGTAILPVSIARDIATFGGELTDGKSSTIKNIKNIKENINKATDPDED